MLKYILQILKTDRLDRGQTRRKVRRALALEPLEKRELMDAGGNSLARATYLGELDGVRQVADYVGRQDVNDYYRVSLEQRSDVRLDLTGMSADADLQLLNANRQVVASSTRGGSSSEVINRTLDAGEYYIRVYRYSGDTNYWLTLTGTPRAVPDYAGNSLAAARDLGTVSGTRTYTDFVGTRDVNDYYSFRLDGRTDFRLQVSELTSDADVELLNGSGAVIASSTRFGNNGEEIRRTLEAGSYYIRVYPFMGSTNYRLTLSATAVAPPDGAGNSMAAARNLGTLQGSVTLQDFVGQADTADFYRFRLASTSNFRLRMDGMTADADVVVLNAAGQVVAASTWGGMNPEAVDQVMAQGDYFVQVYPYGGANTNYRLWMEATLTQQGMDVSTMTPIGDYDGHLGADYLANAGTAVLSPVAGRVLMVQPVDGYGTMAVAIEVTLPEYRWLPTEAENTWTYTNRVIVMLGHLRPSRELVAHGDSQYRFDQGRGELGYGVGSYISVGQRLGYIETHGYEGDSTASHTHVTILDAANAPAGTSYWRGRLGTTDPLRAHYIRPELAWGLMR